MSRYKTFADAMESEVLTEMAGTFFGARKNLDDTIEDFQLHVEELRSREALVFSRVYFLRSLLLGPAGEAEFYAEIGIAPPFEASRRHSGSRTWQPDHLPFSFWPGTRFLKAVLTAYEALRHACEVYMSGEMVDDPERRGRKRMTLHYHYIERLCARLNERIEKLNQDMSPSSVLQFARNIHMADQPGQGTLSNTLGAESLDKGLMYQTIDFGSLGLWRAPALPPPEDCQDAIGRFCSRFYEANAAHIKRVLADLD